MENIRFIQEEDLIECSKLLEEAYSDEPYQENFIEGASLNYLRSKFFNGKDHSFVLTLDDKIIGFIFASLSYWSDGPQFIMEEIVVAKDFRGKGYSQKLNLWLEDHFKGLGVATGMLWVKKESPANKFHKKNGYFDAKDLTIMFKKF
jgi:aminoglycoside 6'-N-acetyltransferase I